MQTGAFRQSALFTSGEDGYHTYRIPAIVATSRGTVLALCEGRKHGRADSGDIDLLVKRSTDAGRTWSGQRVVWDDSANTCGNPCAVQANPIVANGEILFYGQWGLKEDRIGCVAAGPNAEFSSRPFTMPSKPLFFNATARWVGAKEHFQEKQAYIMVELLDEGGRPIPGYNKERCHFQDVDATDLPLLWSDKNGSELAGRTVHLRFYARSARIYAVTTK